MPSGNLAQVAAGTDRAATRPTSDPITSRITKSAPTTLGKCIRSRRPTAGCRRSNPYQSAAILSFSNQGIASTHQNGAADWMKFKIARRFGGIA